MADSKRRFRKLIPESVRNIVSRSRSPRRVGNTTQSSPPGIPNVPGASATAQRPTGKTSHSSHNGTPEVLGGATAAPRQAGDIGQPSPSGTLNVPDGPAVGTSTLTEPWIQAFEIAKSNVSPDEQQFLEQARAGGASTSPKHMAEEAKSHMKERQWMSEESRRKVEKVLKALDMFAITIDTLIQHHPDITALVWAGLRTILLVALNRVEILSTLEEVTGTIAKNMADSQFYASVYISSLQMDLDSTETTDTFRQTLDSALPNFYAAVLVFSVKVRSYFLSTGLDRVTNYLQPFSVVFEQHVLRIEESRKQLEELATMATMEKVKANHEDVRKTYETVVDLKREIDVTLTTISQDVKKLQRTMESAQNDHQLDKLPRADGAAFDSRYLNFIASCLRGTRVAVLDEISDWYKGSSLGPSIYWLNGMAGTGKSTIARTVATACDEENRLGASFFFSKGNDNLSNAKYFFTTIAFQLANTIPDLKPLVCDAITKTPDIHDKVPGVQWKRLILTPLTHLKGAAQGASPKAFVIVIDALDECEGEADVQLIIRLLSEANDLPTVRLQVFVTSRPEICIREGFREMPGIHYKPLVLQNVPQQSVDHDIAVFFQEKLKGVVADPETLRRLVEKASGLFIWAATACRFILGAPFAKEKRLLLLLGTGNPGKNPEKELDRIYASILSESIKGTYDDDEYEEVFQFFRSIVGSIVLLSIPLSVEVLCRLLNEEVEKVDMILENLHSVLDIPEDGANPVRVLHLSFRDFLLSEDRCQDPCVRVDSADGHLTLLNSCLARMSETLKEDIGHIQRPGVSPDDIERSAVDAWLQPEIQYACCRWVDHLLQSKAVLHDEHDVHRFLRDHFLHWLEALSWMGMMTEAVLAMERLQSILPSTGSDCDELKKLVHDAKRFTLRNRDIIERFPLQIYSAALIFTPTTSDIRRHFANSIPGWIQKFPMVKEDSRLLMRTLEGHSGVISGLAFSPDGRLLASGSNSDSTIRLWDTATWACRTMQDNASESVKSLVFSPDGKLLASAGRGRITRCFTVQLWNTATATLHWTSEEQLEYVDELAFSFDGMLLISTKSPVHVWDTSTGSLHGTLEPFPRNHVRAISPDGQLIATAASDKQSGGDVIVKLWDTTTMTVHATLGKFDCSVLVFSPDGNFLAAGLKAGKAILWDRMADWSCRNLDPEYMRTPHRTNLLAFSPNGKRLAVSSTWSPVVSLWDPHRGTLCGNIRNPLDSSNIESLIFSPDGELLACGTLSTLTLWESITCNLRATLAYQRHSRLAFLPQGKLLASASSQSTISLWDLSTEELVPLHPSEEGTERIKTLELSADGKLLASAFGKPDNDVGLWDTSTGSLYSTPGTYPGAVDPGAVEQLAFSPEAGGNILAYRSYDGTVCLWEGGSGAPCRTFVGHSGRITALAFSQDGKILALSSAGTSTIALWDVITGTLLVSLEGDMEDVAALAFSPDGTLLASVSTTVDLWNLSKGALHASIAIGPYVEVNALVFSPDGEFLAAGINALFTSGVQLLDTKTHRSVIEFHMDDPVDYISFSKCGRLLFTDMGAIYLPSTDEIEEPLHSCPLCKIWWMNEKWICYGRQNMVHIPVEVRGPVKRWRNNVLAWSSGPQPRIMHMDASCLPDGLLKEGDNSADAMATIVDPTLDSPDVPDL